MRGFLCLETLTDAEMEVAYYTMVTLTHLIRRTGSDEVTMFSQLASLVLQRMEALAASDQDKALTAFDIFDKRARWPSCWSFTSG